MMIATWSGAKALDAMTVPRAVPLSPFPPSEPEKVRRRMVGIDIRVT